MKLNEAIKEVSVAVSMHDTDKANEGWKVIKSNLEALEQHKALEQELGIDLITLFKAETIYWRIHYIYTDEYSKIMESYKVHIDLSNKCLKVYNEFDDFGYDLHFKNYGKTWALTREELEK